MPSGLKPKSIIRLTAIGTTSVVIAATVYDLAMREIRERTQDLAPFEQVRKIAFLQNEFSIDGGELTPTLKIRRSTIEKKFRSAIDQLYPA